jgi:hypothetical protein
MVFKVCHVSDFVFLDNSASKKSFSEVAKHSAEVTIMLVLQMF